MATPPLYLYLHNFCMETEGEGNILQSLRLELNPQDYGPTDLTSTYTVCTRRVFGLESDALTTRLPTAL
ncbi:hypothetical protein TNCV_2948711 [Trichonephila clavipes]|nr:hypothetical protein TNCV_2948711 [Trichonephila clavipes]